MGSSIENEELSIKRDVDIWSLGCVLSVIVTWLVCNWQTVQEYSTRRRLEVKKTGRFKEEDDCFHNGKDALLDCVRQNHIELAQNVRPRDYVTPEVIKMIDDDMLRPSQPIDTRRKARYLCHEVDRMLREAEEEVSKATQGARSLTNMLPDNSLGSFSGPPLIPPEPPEHTRRLNYNPPLQSPYQPETIQRRPRRPLLPESSFLINGQTHLIPRGRIDYEHSNYQQTIFEEEDTANNLDPMSSLGRASILPHRPCSRYSHRRPGALALLQDQAEDPFCTPLTDYTGGTSGERLDHRMSNHENQNLPVPDSSPITPERKLEVPREELRMQHQKPLPVWQVKDALKWKRVKKDPRNHERINIPGDKNDLEKLKGRDHVRMLSLTFCIC